MTTKAITIQQPWAWAIAAGYKTIENRSWTTSYRGTIAIHAGASLRWLASGCEFLCAQGVIGQPADPRTLEWARNEVKLGAIVAVADLYDIRPVSQLAGNTWASGPYCWMLRSVCRVKPIAVKGQQGLFNLDDSIVNQLGISHA